MMEYLAGKSKWIVSAIILSALLCVIPGLLPAQEKTSDTEYNSKSPLPPFRKGGSETRALQDSSAPSSGEAVYDQSVRPEPPPFLKGGRGDFGSVRDAPEATLPEIPTLPPVDDRSTGSAGAQSTADYILASLKKSGLETGTQDFLTVVPSFNFATIETGGQTFSLHPWGPNLVYLSTTPVEGISGPLVYAGKGGFAAFDGKPVEGGIVLMDMDSEGNWLNAASLGASAVIFLGNRDTTREEYEKKNTNAPLAIPRFFADPEDGRKLKDLATADATAAVKSASSWKNVRVRNCYGLLRGKNRDLDQELIVLEAPYDTYAEVVGWGLGPTSRRQQLFCFPLLND
jgi:hypothetical protein